MLMNPWYKHAWKTMTWGQLITFTVAFTFWATSFIHKSTASYLYLGMLFLFGGLYGFYVTASTIIFQFQAVRNFNMAGTLPKMEIWGFFGN